MKIQSTFNKKGMTLIELLVVMVIAAVLLGGIYRLFTSQSKAYAVQDQVVEVQQNIRIAMEILLKDLRMTGLDDDRTPGAVIATPLIPGDHSLTVRYEHDGAQREVSYWVDETSRLMRQADREWVVGDDGRGGRRGGLHVGLRGRLLTPLETKTGRWTTGRVLQET